MWGVSLHNPSIDLAKYAVQRGASIIEAHFTLDHEQSDFRDHRVAYNPDELSELLTYLENIESTIH